MFIGLHDYTDNMVFYYMGELSRIIIEIEEICRPRPLNINTKHASKSDNRLRRKDIIAVGSDWWEIYAITKNIWEATMCENENT